jgi:cytochrome c553
MGRVLSRASRSRIASTAKYGDRKMDWKICVLGLASAISVGVAGAQGTPAEIKAAAATKAVELCSTCHGPFGISTSPDFPILAAQREGYLEAQIDAFRAHTRAEKDAHDIMWGIAGNLDPAIIKGIAQYYAAQPPAPGRVQNPAAVALGKEVAMNDKRKLTAERAGSAESSMLKEAQLTKQSAGEKMEVKKSDFALSPRFFK